MTQFTTAVITAAALLIGYKLMQKQSQRQAEAVRAGAKKARAASGTSEKDLGALVWDERAGVYRPRS